MQAVEHNRRHPFFIIGFCYCRDPSAMNRQLHRLLLRLQRKGAYPAKLQEIKFYPTPALRKLSYSENEIKTMWSPNYTQIRDEVLDIVLNYSDGVFAGIQDKTAISSDEWTSESLGNHVFKESLIRHIMPTMHVSVVPSIIFDQGRLNPKRTRVFNLDMLESAQHPFWGRIIRVIHDADSLKTPGIWAGDFVAGAFYLAFKHNNSRYIDAMRPKFIGRGYVKF